MSDGLPLPHLNPSYKDATSVVAYADTQVVKLDDGHGGMVTLNPQQLLTHSPTIGEFVTLPPLNGAPQSGQQSIHSYIQKRSIISFLMKWQRAIFSDFDMTVKPPYVQKILQLVEHVPEPEARKFLNDLFDELHNNIISEYRDMLQAGPTLPGQPEPLPTFHEAFIRFNDKLGLIPIIFQQRIGVLPLWAQQLMSDGAKRTIYWDYQEWLRIRAIPEPPAGHPAILAPQ